MTELSTDTFYATSTEDGFMLMEKNKGPIKMILVLSGLAILAVSILLPLAMYGGWVGRSIAPALFWGGLLIVVASIIALILRFSISRDPKIVFNTTNSELLIRRKVIPFANITYINVNVQNMMDKNMVVVFIFINGKKKSVNNNSQGENDLKVWAW